MTLQILSFTEWPATDNALTANVRRIGIIESPNAYQAFDALISEPVFNGKFTLIAIGPDTPPQELQSCDAIFFSEPNPIEIPRLIRKLGEGPVVLIGTYEGFLEDGGLVNLVRRQKKLRFEIQMDNSQRRGIEYRAKLLRLAERIVQE